MKHFSRLSAPLMRRIRFVIARGFVRMVNDALKMQNLQVSLLADETWDNVERLQEYGFTSHPHPNAECIVVFPGGKRDHGIVIAVEDRRYRLKGLAQGEVALYTDEGDYVWLKRGRNIEVLAGTKVKVTAPLTEIVGNATISGTLAVSGAITALAGLAVTGGLTNNSKNVGSTHVHSGVQTGASNTGAPV